MKYKTNFRKAVKLNKCGGRMLAETFCTPYQHSEYERKLGIKPENKEESQTK